MAGAGAQRSGARSPGRVRAVVFDCLGTLLELESPGPRLRAELAERGIAVTEAAAANAFRTEIDYYLAHHLEGRDADGLERLRDACAGVIAGALSVGPERVPSIRAAMLAALSFAPCPDAGPALAALRRAGVRVAVASNWDCSLPGVLARAGLAAMLDAVVTSAAVGAAKPDPRVITAALAAAGARPEEAVCVGDAQHDVAAARAAGSEAILLVRRGDPPAGGSPALFIARSLDEVRSLILARG